MAGYKYDVDFKVSFVCKLTDQPAKMSGRRTIQARDEDDAKKKMSSKIEHDGLYVKLGDPKGIEIGEAVKC